MDELTIKISADLNSAKTASNINKTVSEIEGKLKPVDLQPNINTTKLVESFEIVNGKIGKVNQTVETMADKFKNSITYVRKLNEDTGKLELVAQKQISTNNRDISQKKELLNLQRQINSLNGQTTKLSTKYDYADLADQKKLLALQKELNSAGNFSSLETANAALTTFQSRLTAITEELKLSHSTNLAEINKEIAAEELVNKAKAKQPNLIDIAIAKREKEGAILARQLELQMQLTTSQKAALMGFQTISSATTASSMMQSQINSLTGVTRTSDAGLTRTSIISNSAKDSAKVFENLFAKTQLAANGLSDVERQTYALNPAMNGLNSTVERSGQSFLSSAKKFAQWMIIGTAIMMPIRMIREAVSYLVELDNNLNQIRIVTGKTADEVTNLGIAYNKLAKEMSTTTSEVASTAADIYRQGITNDSDITDRMKAIIEYAKISGLEVTESNDILTASVNSTKANINDLIDTFSYLGDASAAGSDEVGKAFEKTASVASVAGIEYKKLGAYIATVSSITRNSAQTIGNSFKSMLTRYQSIKERGYNDEDAVNTNQITKALAAVAKETGTNINAIDSQTGMLRNYADVLDDIAKVWDKLNPKQKEYLQTTMAGVYQADKFAALMNNYSQSITLYEGALNSAGNADKKFQTYTDSATAHIDSFKASLDNLWQSSLSSNTLKNIIDFGAKFVDLLTQIGSNPLTGLIASIAIGASSLKLLSSAWIKASESNLLYRMSLLKTSVTQKGLIATTMALSTVTKLTLFGAAAAGAIYIAAKAYDHFNISIEEHRQALEDAKSAHNDTKSEIESLNSELKTTQDRITELEGQKSLSLVEENELKKLKEQNSQLEKEIALNEKLLEQEEKKEAKEFTSTVNADLNTENTKTMATENNLGSEGVAYETGFQYYEEQIKAYQYAKKQLDDALSSGDADAVKKIQANMDSIDGILGDGVSQMKDYLDDATYYTGDNLKQWQKDSNEAYDSLNDFINKYLILTGDADDASTVFESIFDSSKFTGANEALTELGNSGELTADKIKDLYNTNDDVKKFIDYLVELGLLDFNDLDELANQINKVDDAADSATTSTLTLANSFTKLSSAKDAISTLSSAFKELSDDGYVSFDTLNDIQEKFADVEGIEGYVKALSEAKGNTAATAEILNELTVAAVNAQYTTEQLANATESEVSAMLKEGGVANSDAVAHDLITNAKAKLKLATFDFANATDSEINALYSELEALGVSESAITSLANAYATAQAAMSIATSSGATARLGILSAELEGVKSVAQAYSLLASSMGLSTATGTELARHVNTNADAQKIVAVGAAYDKINSINVNTTTPVAYSGSGSGSGSSSGSADSSKSYKDATQALIDTIEQAVKLDEIQSKSLENQLETAKSAGDYTEQLRLQNALLQNQQKYVSDLEDSQIKISQAAQSIRDANPQYDTESWFNADGTDTTTYVNLLNSLNSTAQDALAKIHDPLATLKSEYLSLTDTVASAKQQVIEYGEELYNTQYDNSKSYIEDRDFFGDWDKIGDSKIDALKRVMDYTEQYYKDGIISGSLYTSQMKELNKDLYTTMKDDIKSAFELQQKTALKAAETSIYGGQSKESWEDEKQDEITVWQKKLDALQKAYEEKDTEDKEQEYIDKIAELKEKIANLQKDRNVQELKKNEDGTWEYGYVENESDVQSAQDELKDAQKEYDDWLEDQEEKAAEKVYQDKIDANQALIDANAEAYDDQTRTINEHYEDIDTMTDTLYTNLVNKYGAYSSQMITEIDKLYSAAKKANNEAFNIDTDTDTSSSSNSGSSSSNSYDDGLVYDVSSKTGDGTGKAPKGLNVGRIVKTDAGNYLITGVKSDGTYTTKQLFDEGGLLESGTTAVNKSGKPEQILNPEQTSAFKTWMTKVPDLLSNLNLNLLSSFDFNKLNLSSSGGNIEQTVTINATFPNVTSSDEIKSAFNSLTAQARQYVKKY